MTVFNVNGFGICRRLVMGWYLFCNACVCAAVGNFLVTTYNQTRIFWVVGTAEYMLSRMLDVQIRCKLPVSRRLPPLVWVLTPLLISTIYSEFLLSFIQFLNWIYSDWLGACMRWSELDAILLKSNMHSNKVKLS